MPKLIPLASIGVTRDGKTHYPEVGNELNGVPFEFTAEEVAQIRLLEISSKTAMLRNPRNEGGDEGSTVKVFTVADKADVLKAEATARGLDFSGLKSKAELVKLLDENPAKAAADEAVEDEDL